MTSELDIYRAAQALIKQHGEAAALEAAMRADKLIAAGDMEGKSVWVRILKAIDEIQRLGRRADEAAH